MKTFSKLKRTFLSVGLPLVSLSLLTLSFWQCSSDSDDKPAGPFGCSELSVLNLDSSMMQTQIRDSLQMAQNCTRVNFAAGDYDFTGAPITIEKNGILLMGAGSGATKISYPVDSAMAPMATDHALVLRGELISVIGLTIMDAGKNALRIESSDRVLIRDVTADWSSTSGCTTAGMSSNGDYGIYPVESNNVLLESSKACGSSDAGIYVGKSTNVVVRNNEARGNVAGIEIENTANAWVSGNRASDNTGGLVVFDLPSNSEIGINVRLYDNTVTNNNTANFCNSGTVCDIPAGTGTFVLASRQVEIANNMYGNNNTVDIALLNGLALGQPPGDWVASNFNTRNVYIHDNTFETVSNEISGDMPDAGPDLGQVLGGILQVLSQAMTPTIVVDGIDPLADDGRNPVMDDPINVNSQNFCIKDNMALSGLLDMNLSFTQLIFEALMVVAADAAADPNRGPDDDPPRPTADQIALAQMGLPAVGTAVELLPGDALDDYVCDGFTPPLPAEPPFLGDFEDDLLDGDTPTAGG